MLVIGGRSEGQRPQFKFKFEDKAVRFGGSRNYAVQIGGGGTRSSVKRIFSIIT